MSYLAFRAGAKLGWADPLDGLIPGPFGRKTEGVRRRPGRRRPMSADISGRYIRGSTSLAGRNDQDGSASSA